MNKMCTVSKEEDGGSGQAEARTGTPDESGESAQPRTFPSRLPVYHITIMRPTPATVLCACDTS